MSDDVKYFFDAFTPVAAARLVKLVQVKAEERVLDVACGSGAVAVTAARRGAKVSAIDYLAGLVERGKENASIAGVDIEWTTGDAQKLPYADATFDVALSQIGHIFLDRSDEGTREMLRVLKPGGRIGFATWASDIGPIGINQEITAPYFAPPTGPRLFEWGRPAFIRELLGDAVTDVAFDICTVHAPYLSPQHMMAQGQQTTSGVLGTMRLADGVTPDKLGPLVQEMRRTAARFFDEDDNVMRLPFLLTRATKR